MSTFGLRVLAGSVAVGLISLGFASAVGEPWPFAVFPGLALLFVSVAGGDL